MRPFSDLGRKLQERAEALRAEKNRNPRAVLVDGRDIARCPSCGGTSVAVHEMTLEESGKLTGDISCKRCGLHWDAGTGEPL